MSLAISPSDLSESAVSILTTLINQQFDVRFEPGQLIFANVRVSTVPGVNTQMEVVGSEATVFRTPVTVGYNRLDLERLVAGRDLQVELSADVSPLSVPVAEILTEVDWNENWRLSEESFVETEVLVDFDDLQPKYHLTVSNDSLIFTGRLPFSVVLPP